MKKWTSVEKAPTPDGKTISLDEHDGSYTIRVDGAPLMSTRQHESEDKLAEFGCAHLRGRRHARVLIGGLGLGFTLRAALAALDEDASVVVAEILAEVIDWNRNPAYHLAADDMADPRVVIVQQDVMLLIRSEKGGFDSIMLDVDNGPAAVSTVGNDRLYESTGLRHVRAALRPGGCAAYWSAAPDPPFQALMTRAGFTVDVKNCRSRPNAGRWHAIYLGWV